MFQNLINSIPAKWHTNIAKFKIEKDSVYSLSAVLSYLLRCIPQNGELPQMVSVFMEKFGFILQDQFQSFGGDDLLESTNQAFSPSDLHVVISEMLLEIEQKCGQLGLTTSLKILMRTTNKFPQSFKVMELIYDGYLLGVKDSKFPLVFVECSCAEISFTERMSIICETGLTCYAFGPFEGWEAAQNALIIPESDESTFIRHCLSHCYGTNLFVHARKKLEVIQSEEYRTIIGEQIGVWIESLNVEAASTKECKILLLLYLFAKLVSDSVGKQSGAVSSRLAVHLVPIADTLFKWSEKHHVPSLWSALGYSSAKGLPANLRLICRYFSIFVASRMLKSKDWTVEFNSFAIESDFSPHVEYLEKVLKPKFLDENLKIKHFSQELHSLSVYFFGDSFSKLLQYNKV